MNQVGSALDSFFSSPQCQIYVPNISPMKGVHKKDHFSIKLRKMALCAVGRINTRIPGKKLIR
jgi:hypothetical protein